MQEGSLRIQRFKIGMTWPNNVDAYTSEEHLDLNAGIPDRRGRSKSSKLRLGVRSQVLGMRVFEIWFGVFGISMKSNPTKNLRPARESLAARESLVIGGLRLRLYKPKTRETLVLGGSKFAMGFHWNSKNTLTLQVGVNCRRSTGCTTA